MTASAFGGETQQLYAAAVYEPFGSKANTRVTQVSMQSDDALARLMAEAGNPTIDLYQFSGGQEGTASEKGLTADLGDLGGAQLPGGFVDSKRQWTAVAVIPEGIVYNTEKIKDPPRSYADFLNPAYTGHIAFPTITNGYGMDFLVMLARASGGGEKDIDPGFRALGKIAKQATIFKAAAELQTLFAQGGAWIMPYDSSNAYRAKKAGLPVGFSFPKEGSPGSLITYVIAKNSKNVKIAQQAVSFALQPDAQAKIAEQLRWLPTNPKTSLPGDLANEIPVGQAALDRITMLDRKTIGEHRAEWTQRFNQEIAR